MICNSIEVRVGEVMMRVTAMSTVGTVTASNSTWGDVALTTVGVLHTMLRVGELVAAGHAVPALSVRGRHRRSFGSLRNPSIARLK